MNIEKYPLYLQIDLKEMEEVQGTDCSYIDCIEDSLASSIKMALIEGAITEQDAREILNIYPVL